MILAPLLVAALAAPATATATATATVTATVTATASQELPYAELADRFLESKGKANAGPSQTTPSAIL
ncbi:MAG: hypothetical protein ACI9F9_001186, partial [Candidatus Paceibacteria bacterium]